MRPSFNLTILASGSVGLCQSALDSFLPLRLRSSRIEILDRRRRDATLAGHSRQHFAIAFALDQAVLGQTLQHPGEHLVVDFKRQAAAGTAQPGMVRHALALAEAQKFTQRQAVGAAPFQPALTVDAFEVAHQQHPEIAPRRQRRPTTARCIH